MDAVTITPTPVNEPVGSFAPGSPERARLQAKLTELGSTPTEIHHVIGGAAPPRQRPARSTSSSRTGTPRCSAPSPTPRRPTSRDAVAAADAGGAAVAGPAVRRAGRGIPARGRPAVRAVARDARRRDHARPVQDRLPGRDRHPLRADRLLAVQRALRPPDPRRPADLLPRRVEQRRVPPARGLRLRHHPVQLHRDRRQPADRAGADGQHRGVEAVRRPRPSPRTGRCSCSRPPGCPPGRDQPGHRRRARGLRRRAGRPAAWPASTSPARPPPSSTCGARSATTSPATTATRGWSARPAARTSSSRTASADPDVLTTALIRGAFDYQGQKCSAASRAFVPPRSGRKMGDDFIDQGRPR